MIGSAVPRLMRTCLALMAMQLLPTPALAQADRLAGTWLMFNEQKFKFERTATLTAAGNQVIVNNGAGLTGPADVRGNMIILHGLLTGTVSANNDLITWSNGYQWVRQGSNVSVAPPPPTIDLAGEWTGIYADGRKAPRAGRITQRGDVLSFDNGEGSVSAGKISGHAVEATGWSLTGEITTDGKSIVWSNKTTWRRRTEADVREAARPLPREVRAFANGRQIDFRNDAGFVAEMQVSYFDAASTQLTTVSSGKLAVAQSKTFWIPDTVVKTPITIRIVGVATTNDRFFTTTLNGDDDFPRQCFKAWGTLFSPQGGKC